mgnify:CR=1 FL=1
MIYLFTGVFIGAALMYCFVELRKLKRKEIPHNLEQAAGSVKKSKISFLK